MCAVTYRQKQKKAIHFSLKPSNSMFLKGKSRYVMKFDAQEIEESCTLSVNHKF